MRSPRPMEGGIHPIDWGCELVGTALVLLAGLSAVTLDFGCGSAVARAVPSTSMRLLLTGALFPLTGSLLALSPLGRRSGAHFNPAVTAAFWVLGRVRGSDVAGYVGAQCAGALAGTALVRALWSTRTACAGHGVTHPGHGIGLLGAGLLEAGMTAVLLTLIFLMLSSRRTMHYAPLAVWALIAVLVWQVAPYTGTSLNPARSLGPAIVFSSTDGLWLYLLAPLTGAVLAAVLWRVAPTERRTLTAKLFHDSRYPSVLGTEIPVRR